MVPPSSDRWLLLASPVVSTQAIPLLLPKSPILLKEIWDHNVQVAWGISVVSPISLAPFHLHEVMLITGI